MIVFDNNIEYLLGFISAIFGLSIPIMLQVIERVDQRYASTRLAERLKSEKIIRWCIYILIASLIACTYTVFARFNSFWDYWLLNNSANLIAIILCIALITFFLLSCKVILCYYNPERLQDRILKAYAKAKSEDDREKHFLDWVDLTKVLLQTSDRIPAYKVYDTIANEIKRAYDSANDNGVSFPSYLIRGIISIDENICLMQRRPFSVNNGNQILKNLISQPLKLSDEAYRLLWQNLQLQLFYGQEDWVYEYWSAAAQTYDFNLAELYSGYPAFGESAPLVTEADAEARREKRLRFLEFHITLCADILREKRYGLLEKIIVFHHVWPPEYPMVPSSLPEILSCFKMVEESSRFDMGVEGYYPMRGMKGIVDGIVMGSVKRYLTFLYVRLFSNIGMLTNISAIMPNELGKLKRMDEDIRYMQRMLPSILENEDLMRLLSFDDLHSKKEEIKETLNNIRAQISAKQKEIRVNGSFDPDKINQNFEDAKEIVIQRLEAYSCFVSAKQESSDANYYLDGNKSFVYPNAAFQKDPDISYVDLAEGVAGSSITRFQHVFASVFFQKEQKRFRINSADVFSALDKLAIGEDYIIVSFGIYWDFYLQMKVGGFVKEDGAYKYMGAPIICLNGGPTQIVSQTLFVLRKTDLPKLTYIAPMEEHIKKYKLELIDENFKLYANILQLSQNPSLLAEVKDMTEDEAKEHSLFLLFLNAKMTWAKAAPVVSIKLMYSLRDNGTPDSIDSIAPFAKLFGG